MGGMGDVSRLNRDAHYWGLKPLARDNLLGGADASVRERDEARRTQGFLWDE